MIVPLTYFIEKPVLNWTYQSTEQIGSISLGVDDVWARIALRTGRRADDLGGARCQWCR
jgi:hypothetical protein